MAASGPVLDRVIAEKRRDDAHGATITQLAVANFLSDGLYPAQLALALERYRVRPRRVARRARRRSSGSWRTFTRSAGGGHVWVTLRYAIDDVSLYRAALDAGVTFVPGPAMLVERPRATHLRLSYGLPDSALIREGVRRLAGVIRAGAERTAHRRSLPVT